jgi:cell division protein FtsQ
VPLYQGHALASRARRRRRPPGRLLGLAAAALLLGLVAARLPWDSWRARFAVVTHVEVRGNRYLDADRVVAVARVAHGDDLLSLRPSRLRDRLLRHPRIARARVSRAWLRGVRIEVEERVPALIVDHGTPWEMDAHGVLMPPLSAGALADVPLLTGPDLERLPAGTTVTSPEVLRALAWLEALVEPRLRLAGGVSEIDVSASGLTALVLAQGTRVLAPPAPPGVERLSALRVVLADLEHRGIAAGEVDLRFADQVVVRPVAAAAARPATAILTPGGE